MFCAHYPCFIYQHVIIIYTFAQSTQCLYINSYFMSHLIFFLYMCIQYARCYQMLQDNMKEIETYYPNDSMCVYVSECYDFITPFFFQCERNKSPCRNSALMYNIYVNHRSRVYNMLKIYGDMKCK